jgi:NAD(P)-dependent dehydrogenase (short-subunit alcohol dehydrogenase family)
MNIELENMASTPSEVAAEMFGLRGKIVLVTGASKGIGEAVAQECAAAGARVVLCGRDVGRLQATLASLAGDGHRALPAELTDMEEVKQLAADCGPLDGIVHSAGIRGLAPMKIVGDAFLHEVMNTNYIAPMMLTRHLLARQALRPGGSIVLLSSIAALTGTVGVGPYSGSKAALIGTMRPLALELARRGMRVNALCPGLVETSLITEDPEWFEESRKRYPLGIGQPLDIARACLFLLSNASRKITGISFSMDGGVEFV